MFYNLEYDGWYEINLMTRVQLYKPFGINVTCTYRERWIENLHTFMAID